MIHPTSPAPGRDLETDHDSVEAEALALSVTIARRYDREITRRREAVVTRAGGPAMTRLPLDVARTLLPEALSICRYRDPEDRICHDIRIGSADWCDHPPYRLLADEPWLVGDFMARRDILHISLIIVVAEMRMSGLVDSEEIKTTYAGSPPPWLQGGTSPGK